ncbi:hypothetical protein [Oceanobacter mangrovi]|uniref:hypothetical protein n=1 Tax=Oceanobacter mangrovi TaxID=2862510 RepID=UPI001C8E2EA6|nr:hypothetical protein [Oceanobacter mangrovi]
MSAVVDRLNLLLDLEKVKMPWLEQKTGIKAGKWHKVRRRENEMKTSELEAIAQVWPEYAYWLTTGLELPAAGQISPMTKWEQQRSQTPPAAG